jgi:sRNA-binding regulator protein Hfq
MNQDNVSHLNKSYAIANSRYPAVQPNGEGKKKFVAVGHDKQLEEAQFNKFPVSLGMVSSGIIRGIIVRRDRYTITIRHSSGANEGFDEIVFKSAIEGIIIERTSTVQ